MTKEAYCSYEISKLLKKKGFNSPCHAIWYDDRIVLLAHLIDNDSLLLTDEYKFSIQKESLITIPTHQMACDWLRDIHKVLIVIDAYHADHWEGYIDSYEISIYSHASTIIVPNEIAHHTDYTEAVEAALKYSIENLI